MNLANTPIIIISTEYNKAAHLSDISEDCFPFITLLNHEFVIVKEINDGLL